MPSRRHPWTTPRCSTSSSRKASSVRTPSSSTPPPARQDLADKEAAELAVIQSYLPKPLTEEELTALIDATIAEVGATSPREMGKVISAIMATHKGRVDGKALSAAVKARLTA